MTKEQAIQEMLRHAEMLLGRGEVKQASTLLDRVLRMDFINQRAWLTLYQMHGKDNPFTVFQRAYAQEHYSDRAHLLAAQDSAILSQAEVAPLSDDSTQQAKRQPAEKHLPVVQNEPERKKLYCPNCGVLNLDGARYCDRCGTQLFKATAPAPAPPQQPVMMQPYPIPQSPPPQPVILQPLSRAQPEPQPVVLQSISPQIIIEQKITCPNCRRENLRDSYLCAYCGFPIYPAANPVNPAHQNKPGKIEPKMSPRFLFIDLGLFAVAVSALLTWVSISTVALWIPSEETYTGYRVMAEFTGGAQINVVVTFFFIFAGVATILMHARKRALAVIAALISLASMGYSFFTLRYIAGQQFGYSNWLYSDISVMHLREGIYIALAGAVLLFLGTVFSKNKASRR